jgi:MFS superfamily sulfate permease-like transporter
MMNSPSRPAALPPITSDHWRRDLISGGLVFLVALPLCLAISLASGVPATAGVLTAIVGSLVATCLSNSQLTIKGPAAGLIVIVLGCVLDFQAFAAQGGEVTPEVQLSAYRLMLAVAVVSGLLQVLFAITRTGILGEIFPVAAVHGMLAAIGVIIMSKQIHLVLGVKPHATEPLELLAEIPRSISGLNPEIALIGCLSLLLLFLWPFISFGGIKRIPAQLIVLLLGVPLGIFFDLDHTHTYTFANVQYELGPKHLVDVPNRFLEAIVFPDFSQITSATSLKWIVMFSLIGTLESLLSAKAVDLLDPWKRKADLNRDLLAVGVGNTLAAAIGGLPMISEIVRSKANIDNGAQTRFANLFHGLFLLMFVSMLPLLIHRIPLCALAAMLVFTGFRLASPREFLHVYQVGPEQLVVFVVTLVTTLATDLLVGIGAGVVTKIALHLYHGVTVKNLLINEADIIDNGDGTVTVAVSGSAVFSNWLSLRKKILSLPLDKGVILDLSKSKLVDHTVMGKLHELQEEFQLKHRSLVITGLDEHQRFSDHPLAACRLPGEKTVSEESASIPT